MTQAQMGIYKTHQFFVPSILLFSVLIIINRASCGYALGKPDQEREMIPLFLFEDLDNISSSEAVEEIHSIMTRCNKEFKPGA